MTRSLPTYLKVVPHTAKRFRRPKPRIPPTPLARDGRAVAGMVEQAERVQALVERLHKVIYVGDEIVARALVDRLEIESRWVGTLARGLRDDTVSC